MYLVSNIIYYFVYKDRLSLLGLIIIFISNMGLKTSSWLISRSLFFQFSDKDTNIIRNIETNYHFILTNDWHYILY